MVEIVNELQDIYAGLLDTTYRGIAFTMPDSRDEVGRRSLRFLFPGQDGASFQDLGANDGTIRITGLIVGDDYKHRADRMRQAFRTRGPATLVHPWLGEMQVVLVGEPPAITFSVGELRVARFEATFWPFLPRTAQPADSLTALEDQLDDLRVQIDAYLAGVLAPIAQTLGVIATVASFASQLQGYFDGLLGGAPVGSDIAGVAAPSVAALTTPLPAGAGYAAAATAALAAPSAAIAASSNPPTPSAIGPGDQAMPTTPTDPRLTTSVLVAAAGMVATTATGARPSPAPTPALTAAIGGLIVADAIQASTDIPYTSDVDAAGVMTGLLGAIDMVTGQIEAILAKPTRSGLAVPAGTMAAAALAWKSLTATRAALLADFSSVIGRLPAVVSLRINRSLPAWLIAQYLSGDDPSLVVATLQDLVARNRLTLPAVVMPGTIEVLSP